MRTYTLEYLYAEFRPPMVRLAYRMLGSLLEAEDAVQDVFASLQGKSIPEDVEDWEAYLMKTTANRCLNRLRSAKRRRETYPGTWLPEPIYEGELQPEAAAERKEGLSYAMLALMERLTPTERAVFVLREAFAVEYADIASWLGKTDAGCRQLYSRAKRKLQTEWNAAERPAVEHGAQLVEAFIAAAGTGDFRSFVATLTDGVVLISDGGGVVRSAVNPIYGRDRVLAFFQGIAKKNGVLRGEVRMVPLNGEPAVVFYQDGQPSLAICFGDLSEAGRIASLYWIRNPLKLKGLPALE